MPITETLARTPIRISTCTHTKDHSVSLKIENRHLDFTAYPYSHTDGMVTSVSIFGLTRQDIIDLAHELLAAAIPIEDPVPDAPAQG